MRRLALPLLALSLAGCQTTRYVPVHCLSQDQLDTIRKSEPPKVADKLTGQAQEDSKILAGSAVRLRAWGVGMLGVLEGCAKPAAG